MPVPVPSEQVGPVRRARMTIDMRPTPSDSSRSTIQNLIIRRRTLLFGRILCKFIEHKRETRGCWLGVFVSANKYSKPSTSPQKWLQGAFAT